MSMIDELERWIGPPLTTPEPVDWVAAEAVLGMPFPDDYKELWDRHPPLRLNEIWQFAHPSTLVPAEGVVGSDYAVADFARAFARWGAVVEVEGVDRTVADREFRCHPEVPGLLRWGFHDQVSGLMWLTDPDPARWTVVVSDLRNWWHFGGGLVEFMVGVFSGAVDCPLIGERWREATVEELVGHGPEEIIGPPDALTVTTYVPEIWRPRPRPT